MALSREAVRQIVIVVSNDPECVRRVNSWIRGPVFGAFAGPARDFGLALGNVATLTTAFDPQDVESVAYQYSCAGIAAATAIGIRQAIDAVPDVIAVVEQSREVGHAHSGTMIRMRDKTQYVLDWWKSLDVWNPRIFQHYDFVHNIGNGVAFADFKGFA
jgi:hypothetical protein